MKKIYISVLIWVWVGVWCFAQDSLAKGEDLFLQDKPQEAAVFLEQAIAEDPTQIEAFLYLGIVYEQTGRIDEAIAVYRQVLDDAGDLTANVANNLGNAYFNKGSIAEAEEMYTQALEADSMYASAYLGRANARVQKGSLRDAIADYEQYLLLEPQSPQRSSIEQLVTFIEAEFAETEQQRHAAEDIARAEAERRQRLLDEVPASLHGAAEARQGLSAGTEQVEVYEEEG